MTTHITQPLLSYSNQVDIANYINLYRSKHSAPPLTFDTTISKFTQTWTYTMARTKKFSHSNTNLYGENIAYLQGYGTDPVALIKKSIDLWYNEVAQYDFNNPGFSDATGHFTCLVWIASQSFGIGISIVDSTNEVYISFNTYPPGNVLGQFQQNVLPPVVTPDGSLVPSPPIPSPTPSPPIPTPTPEPTPPVPAPIIPIRQPLDKNKVISQLYSIMYMITKSQSRNAIITAINQVVHEINESA